ncbi:CDGSH iron-sulfur domain-containing protein [Alicyclobacillus tolerans]|uniref:Zn-finger domain of CDGSH type-containing protein n=2 Tax=Alicyclobacillus tolerans TaxID=90970 RepID=A0A1M6N5K8_9BACL|nr:MULTISPECIES: CDGSH iron-sulfur domain-containing protein [Alicyclobacillus]MDP9728044.1 CDGSH-type Zn-finger protein [Alicyclobacillus tengchongensis]QRF24325.1 CDGSH iron-sulfur domain-containing protein [Alicyclobacillus sp. TC]SHJ90988.1 Zn-finger domain of CDGSH type-containing protein [Alicyclobacillus montanus]
MSEEIVIKVNDNGSLRVKGPVILEDAEGNRFTVKESFSLCRCGHSQNKPFCDGSHRSAGFSDCARAK